jgi:hypothetical protein
MVDFDAAWHLIKVEILFYFWKIWNQIKFKNED